MIQTTTPSPHQAARFSVAPMMAWTDRHCRALHRQLSRHALLYTEMVTAAALVHGDRAVLLRHDGAEHPVAVQLGGADPAMLRDATQHCVDAGFCEVNLNVGCPSDRVQSGAFGAVLMKTPALVARCVNAMQSVTGADITVKCRIGVDDQDPAVVLPAFLALMQAHGVRRITVHARMAWLQGLSPKENRDIPPLDYDLVLRMKDQFPDLHLTLNGGIADISTAQALLARGVDGVMLGRAAYHTPDKTLRFVDRDIFGQAGAPPSTWDVVQNMRPHIAQHLDTGGRLHDITRHMLGLFAGQKGAKYWRRGLSTLGAQKQATLDDFDSFLETCHGFANVQGEVAAE